MSAFNKKARHKAVDGDLSSAAEISHQHLFAKTINERGAMTSRSNLLLEVFQMATTITKHNVVTPTQITIASVIVNGYFYIVDLGDPVRPRHHHVGINGECTCILGRNCPAVDEVRKYLADGGKRAERPPFGFYPVHPAKCPIKGCGARVHYDASLSSRNRSADWQGSVAGVSHYWQHRGWITSMRRKFAVQGKNI